MSNDPKKPLDAPPAQTPELLQKDLSLDRRRREAAKPHELPTDPERPFVGREQVVTTTPMTPRAPAVPAQPPRLPQPPRPTGSVAAPSTGLPPRPTGSMAAQSQQPQAPRGTGSMATQPQAPRATGSMAAQRPVVAPPSPTQWSAQQQQLAHEQTQLRAPQPQAAWSPTHGDTHVRGRDEQANHETTIRPLPQAPAPATARENQPQTTIRPLPQAHLETALRPLPLAQQETNVRPLPQAQVETTLRPAPTQGGAPAVQRGLPTVTPMQANHGATSVPTRPPVPAAAPPGLTARAAPQAPAARAAPPVAVAAALPVAAPPDPASVAPSRSPVSTADAAYRAIPGALPAHLLVTQPGVPGPFAKPAAPPLGVERASAAPPAHVPATATPVQAPRTTAPVMSAAMPEATVTATPAGLVRRVAAWLIDLLFICGLAGGFVFVAAMSIAPRGAALMRSLMTVALPALALAAVFAFVYTTLFAFLFRGRTVGRRLTGIHLVDGTGAAPGAGRALVRAGLSLVSFGLFLSGFWLALFDRHGQTLHDKLTRTFVVRLIDA